MFQLHDLKCAQRAGQIVNCYESMSQFSPRFSCVRSCVYSNRMGSLLVKNPFFILYIPVCMHKAKCSN